MWKHSTAIAAFFKLFNRFFDWLSNNYGSIVGGLARKATRSMLLLVAVVGGILLVGKFVPGASSPAASSAMGAAVAAAASSASGALNSDEISKGLGLKK